MIPTQLPLGLRLPAASRFDNFVAGPNRETVTAIEQLTLDRTASVLFITGAAGSGKTHLLQAACRAVETGGEAAVYLPLTTFSTMNPGILEGLEHYALIALDDVQAIAGQVDWEEALFHLYNRLREAQGRLLAAAAAPPDQLNIELPDLRSRLGWGAVYALQLPDDAMRLQILALRAQACGLELPDETARYLLRRCPRDLPALIALLERLDHAALAAQRRLTVPFVKAVLES
ncbi:MAG: DnaA regulatory inactivator Hda [Gammaproteobacteria bacterium]|nr:DnaA regulatory inactivator Hda [Gammaproteobacteria bacterium]MBU2477585.1 DnaA regulatory inactivator Hda [Gammaproteobacteria bacterium]